MKVLITGRSGTGKTTLCNEFIRQGVRAIDSDRLDNFVGWYNVDTKLPATVDYRKRIDKSTFGWLWHHDAMKQLVAKYSDLILCGSADNQLEFYKYFDKVYILDLPPDVQKQRILQRTDHDYGKQADMLRQITEEQSVLVRTSIEQGALRIDATKSPLQIARLILKDIK